jgi:membrane protein implicated in regulation of membrane protease activity
MLLNFLQIGVPLSDPDFWWLLLILLVIGLIAILFFSFLLAFPIASLAAIAVFLLTGSLLWSGITFLIVALIVAAIGKTSRTRLEHRHHEHEEHVHHED